MSAPVRLPVQTPHEQLSAVAVPMLERLLEKARRGELESLFVCYETDGFEGLQWNQAGTLSTSQTLGRIEILKAQLLYGFLGPAQVDES